MILGRAQNSRTILDIMHESEIFFYPTGSRFFGTSTPASDYDFFVQDNAEVIHFLKENGFYKLSTTTYNDSLCLSVYHRSAEDNSRIDVQVVSNALTKFTVQNIFKKNGILDPSTEQWNTAVMFATSTNEVKLEHKIDVPDYHQFRNFIHAIKYMRENYKDDRTMEYPSLLNAKRFVESVMMMAQRIKK